MRVKYFLIIGLIASGLLFLMGELRTTQAQESISHNIIEAYIK